MRDPLAEPSDLIRSVSRALRVLESVGRAPRGLTVKQIARRCELTVATTYHLVRTLAYEGYVIRREDGTYVVGLEIADRYRELVSAFRGPPAVGEVLRRAGALLILKTDHREYYETASALAGTESVSECFDVSASSADVWADEAVLAHTAARCFAGETTSFEARFRRKRKPIHYLELCRR